MELLRSANDALERLTGRRLTSRQGSLRQGAAQFREMRNRATYAALGQLYLRSAQKNWDRPIDLRLAELKVFSQNGEDGVIDALLQALDIEANYFVEFGVGDGSECNTRLLAEVLGWSGLYIEPATHHFDTLATRYRYSPRVSCVHMAVTPANVNELFANAAVPHEFGLLSIDVDGQDYWIWESLSNDYQPAVVVIECNTGFLPYSRTIEAKGLAWSDNYRDSFGASVSALVDLADTKGYALAHVEMCGVNAFFVRRELLNLLRAGLVGVTERSPNYFLEGRGHPATGALD